MVFKMKMLENAQDVLEKMLYVFTTGDHISTKKLELDCLALPKPSDRNQVKHHKYYLHIYRG